MANETEVSVSEVTSPGEICINTTKSLGGKEYINAIGGQHLYNREQFVNSEISISFIGNNLSPYNQRCGVFEAGLSIIDVMMFNDPVAIGKLIDDTYHL